MGRQSYQSSTPSESERQHARRHRARANHIRGRMDDLPENVRNEMPLTDDPWELAAAERTIRQEYAARIAASKPAADPAKGGA